MAFGGGRTVEVHGGSQRWEQVGARCVGRYGPGPSVEARDLSERAEFSVVTPDRQRRRAGLRGVLTHRLKGKEGVE